MRADNEDFTLEEVRETVVQALCKDWQVEVSLDLLQRIQGIFFDRQETLFKGGKVQKLEALRRVTVGYHLAGVFLDFVIQNMVAGNEDEGVLVKSVCDTFTDRMARSERQIREHYLRWCEPGRVHRLVKRLGHSQSLVDRTTLAKDLLGYKDADIPALASGRHYGLKNGVRI